MTMLSRERTFRIMELINQKGFVSVSELMQLLQASRSSITRDLIQLEKQGLIQREHGGASHLNKPHLVSTYNELGVKDKINLKQEDKTNVCMLASQIIEDGDCIFLDSGTTIVHLLPFIANKNITIVTPSVYLINQLPPQFKGTIFLIGGAFDRKYNTSLGHMTIEQINQFNFDHAFYSTNGVDLHSQEVYIADVSIVAIKKAVIKRSTNNYLLIDDSKYSVRALCSWGTTDQFTKVFTNDYPNNMEYPSNFIICK